MEKNYESLKADLKSKLEKILRMESEINLKNIKINEFQLKFEKENKEKLKISTKFTNLEKEICNSKKNFEETLFKKKEEENYLMGNIKEYKKKLEEIQKLYQIKIQSDYNNEIIKLNEKISKYQEKINEIDEKFNKSNTFYNEKLENCFSIVNILITFIFNLFSEFFDKIGFHKNFFNYFFEIYYKCTKKIENHSKINKMYLRFRKVTYAIIAIIKMKRKIKTNVN